MRRKKSKKRGVRGRRWTRKDRPTLAPGQRDASGFLEIVKPNAGTKGRNRYAVASCHCGCRVGHIEVRVDNFLGGKASCPTRRKAANRRAIERKQHIEMMRRIGAILDGKNLPDAAKQPAINYARHLAIDVTLQASVRQSFKSDLAERDLKRASEVVEKYCKTNEREPVKPTAVMSPPKPTHTPERLLDIANMKRISSEDLHRLVKNGQWTAAGRAAFLAGQPSVEARKETAVKPVTPMPIESPPIVNRNPLLVERPYEETDAGYDALQAYWDEHKQMPSEGFDLKAWYTSVLAARRCARASRVNVEIQAK